jgi:hypothetical protein
VTVMARRAGLARYHASPALVSDHSVPAETRKPGDPSAPSSARGARPNPSSRAAEPKKLTASATKGTADDRENRTPPTAGPTVSSPAVAPTDNSALASARRGPATIAGSVAWVEPAKKVSQTPTANPTP